MPAETHAMLPDQSVGAAVLALTGRTVVETRPLPGGCVGSVTLCRLADGDTCVVKQAGMGESLECEARMLAYLAAHSRLPLPQVLAADASAIVMSFVPQDGDYDARAQGHAGELIAALHEVTAPRFGLDFDTQIGPLAQPNPWSERWLPFLREQRLVHMAGLARASGRLPAELHLRVLRLADGLERWIGEPARASLLHGDLWVGNVLVADGQVTAFIDPAISYGDPEMDLALANLFGPFREPFFAAYRSVRALDEDFFRVRRDVYSVYPLLMHVALVGEPYVAQLAGVLRKLGQ
jgi:fructosamine-3-kinase